VVLNVRQALDAALIQKHLAGLLKQSLRSPRLRAIFDPLKLDPLQDVAGLTLAVSRPAALDSWLLLVEGRFDPDRFQTQKVLPRHVVPDGRGGQYHLYEVQMLDFGGFAAVPAVPVRAFVAVLSPTTLVIAPDQATAVTALDKAAGTRRTALRDPRQALLEQPGPRPTLWLALLGSVRLALTEPTLQQAHGIEMVRGGLTVAEDVRAEYVLTATDAEAGGRLARQMEDGVSQPKGLAAVQLKTQPELAALADVLQTLQITATGDTVTVQGRMGQDIIPRLLKGYRERVVIYHWLFAFSSGCFSGQDR
jgi:hypothetical protein